MTNIDQQHGLNPYMFVFPVPPKETTVIVDPSGPILEGSSVSLLCRSRANPPVTNYTWYKDDQEDKEHESSLVINGVDPSDSGVYHCAVKSELGEETSEQIQLDIQCKCFFYRFTQENCMFPVCIWLYCICSCGYPNMIRSQDSRQCLDCGQ